MAQFIPPPWHSGTSRLTRPPLSRNRGSTPGCTPPSENPSYAHRASR